MNIEGSLVTRLFKRDKGDTLRYWEVEAVDGVLYKRHGVVGGDEIEHEEYVESNTLRDEVEQAEFMMESAITKRLKNGYKQTVEEAASCEKNLNQLGHEKQMKANLLKDGSKPPVDVFDRNAFVQRKYNGHRCTVVHDGDKIFAYSSGGNLITSIDHILNEININPYQKIDGELYQHGLSLQKISSLVRKQNVQAPDMNFVIFDSISTDKFIVRYNKVDIQTSSNIFKADTFSVSDFEEVKKLFFQFRSEGYEGAMLRHGEFGYEAGTRGKSIYKIKKVDGEGYYDEEFLVIDIIPSKKGHAKLICVTEKGLEFSVFAHGNHKKKKSILDNKEKHIGKKVMVQFPEWTDSGKPSQPIAIMWRDKETE